MSRCLSDAELDRYHAGDMSEAQAAAAREHLAGCQQCAARSAALVAEHEDIVRHLRGLDACPTPALPGRSLDARAHDHRHGFSDEGASASASVSAWAHKPGDQIGSYRLLELLGEGGFGVVYLAEQSQPVRRRVALKILKPGMDTHRVVARFEAERQALAMMDHPNVAKVLDAGATAQGRPYFAMEYVQGMPITAYCDRQRLDTPSRLELFEQVCHAVQHAHQKGIIHRDLKPSNVLVTIQDQRAVPKVIDFGVAKAISRQLTEQTIYTEQGQLIGTPEYMSPEQAEMTGLNIDTRTDVYSLGVLLYELLVGTLPFDPQSLRRAGYAEIQRVIREQEPPKPSTRLSSLGGQSVAVVHQRRTDLPTLVSQLRGDLDWIILKAMEKDRTRRYSTASELAADVSHYLCNEVVSACPPSTVYRLRKFVRRHRIGVLSAVAVAAALVLGVIGTTTMAVAASRERQAAVAARDAAEQAQLAEQRQREAAEQARAEAERQTAIARSVNAFLQDMLGAADPFGGEPAGLARTANVVDMLDVAAKRIETRFAGQPEAEAGVQSMLGTTYLGLSLLEPAERRLDRALALRREILGEEHPDTLKSRNDWARLLTSQGKYAEAEKEQLAVLDARRRVLGSEDPDTLASESDWGGLLFRRGRLAEAEKVLRDVWTVRRRVLGDDHLDTLRSLNDLALLLRTEGRLDEAEPLQRAAEENTRRVLGKNHPDAITALSNLALLTYAKGDKVEAERMLSDALVRFRESLSEEHGHTLTMMNNLAVLKQELGKTTEAEELLRRALGIQRRVMGDRHVDTLTSLHNLSGVLEEQGRLAEAEQLEREVVEGLRGSLGPDHPSTLTACETLSRLLFNQGKYAEAEAEFSRTLEAYKRLSLGDSPDAETVLYWLARCAAGQARWAQAEERWRQLLEMQTRRLGENDKTTAGTLRWLGGALADGGKTDEAEQVYRRSAAAYRSTVGLDDRDTLGAIVDLAMLLKQRSGSGAAEILSDEEKKASGEAERLLREALGAQRRSLGADDRHTLITMNNLACLLRDRGRTAEAEPLFRELVNAADRTLPPDHDYLAIFHGQYGRCLLKMGRYEEAEPHLESSHAALLAKHGPTHARVQESLGNLTALYDAWGRPEKAEELRARFPATAPSTASTTGP